MRVAKAFAEMRRHLTMRFLCDAETGLSLLRVLLENSGAARKPVQR